MSQSFYQQFNLLITPNKCGSSTAESWLRHCAVDNAAAQQFGARPEVSVWCTTRSPVEYLVSGWRFLLCAPDPSDRKTVNPNFKQHLRECVQHRDNYHLQRSDRVLCINGEHVQQYPCYFAGHAWWGPRRTVEQDFGFDSATVNWIQLEDPNALRNSIRKLYGFKTPHNGFFNQSSVQHAPYPELDAETVDLMRELDNWSKLCGYDFDETVERYNRRINTL